MKRTDTEIKNQGFLALAATLGMVEAERFIALIQREPFDYTYFQRTLFKGMNVKELSKAAMKGKK